MENNNISKVRENEEMTDLDEFLKELFEQPIKPPFKLGYSICTDPTVCTCVDFMVCTCGDVTEFDDLFKELFKQPIEFPFKTEYST